MRLPAIINSLILAVLVVGSAWAGQAGRRVQFVLDPTRPFVDLVFDHVAKRDPVFPEESQRGIWIRLINNCVYSIQVNILNTKTSNKGILLTYTIVRVVPEFITVPAIKPTAPETPAGYSSGHVVNSIEIEPSKSVLFSVPAEHVTRDWFIRIEIELLIGKPQHGRQPRIFTEFGWQDLPPNARHLLEYSQRAPANDGFTR